MYLDIAICIYLVICIAIGFWRGFMRGIIGFISGTLSFMAAFFMAKPLAKLAQNWFGMSKALNKILTNNGNFLSMLIWGIIVYLICRLIFYFIGKVIKRIKERNAGIDVADRIGGIFLGLAKGIFSIAMIFVTLYLMSSIPLVDKLADWLLKGSHIGKFIYGLTEKLVIPWFGEMINGMGK